MVWLPSLSSCSATVFMFFVPTGFVILVPDYVALRASMERKRERERARARERERERRRKGEREHSPALMSVMPIRGAGVRGGERVHPERYAIMCICRRARMIVRAPPGKHACLP